MRLCVSSGHCGRVGKLPFKFQIGDWIFTTPLKPISGERSPSEGNYRMPPDFLQIFGEAYYVSLSRCGASEGVRIRPASVAKEDE